MDITMSRLVHCDAQTSNGFENGSWISSMCQDLGISVRTLLLVAV